MSYLPFYKISLQLPFGIFNEPLHKALKYNLVLDDLQILKESFRVA